MLKTPLVSFVIVARNSERYLSDLLGDFLAQDYPLESIELLYIDSASDDNSIEIVRDFRNKNPQLTMFIMNNPKKLLSCGWNVALRHAHGDVIVRVDAHARIPNDFIRRNVEVIQSGRSIVGGQIISIVPKEKWSAFFALAEASKFGAGIADFRNPGPARCVDTLAHAAYCREVFLKVGGYDERLGRTEDNEIHQRMKDAGFELYFSPQIKSYHYKRSNLKGSINQKYSNGYWVGLTLAISMRCFSLRHYVPLLFVLNCIIGVVFGFLYSWIPVNVMFSSYLACAIYFSYESTLSSPPTVRPLCAFLPLIFLLMHVSYGVGTMRGLLSIPMFLLKQRRHKVEVHSVILGSVSRS
jgi:glycosyltransferase involved in cell wall biosynthesis